MQSKTIFCPGGIKSQTGGAVHERYPKASISNFGEDIAQALDLLGSTEGPFVVPLWNSHVGEIKKAEYVWDHIEAAKIKISDLWAKGIEFWYVKRSGDPEKIHGKIGSAVVAATQCSEFLGRQSVELVKCALTTVAFDEYRKGALWDGVLVAPGQGENESGYEVVSKQTANPNNFTSFVMFVPARSFAADAKTITSWLTGVTMRPLGVTLGDIEQSFFDQMLSGIKNLSEIPKLIFVLKRTSKVGLLFEGVKLSASDLLDVEELESRDILVYEDAGAMAKQYTEELRALFERDFQSLVHGDFVLHRGVNTCLFACPPLDLYTHGYQAEMVEPVVRFYIHKLFQLWDNGVQCNEKQMEFFERNKDAWQENGSKFMTFKEISAAGS